MGLSSKPDSVRGNQRKEGHVAPATRPEISSFSLLLRGMEVGELTYDSSTWRFRYSEGFKSHPSLRPIVGFPDPDAEYNTTKLWPFFAMRIPSLEQSAVRQAIADESLDDLNQADLLGRFGKRTVSNPFELGVRHKDQLFS